MIPSTFKMVDLGELDLAEINGSEVPGIYAKISEAYNTSRIVILCNWKFAGVVIAPSYVSITVDDNDNFVINNLIVVDTEDTVYLIGVVPSPTLVELTATENGIYIPPEGVDGFEKVTVDVPPPVLETLTATQNGTYTPGQGKDGFDEVVVNVPPPVLETLTATENGTYTPEQGKDGFDEVVVNVPSSPSVFATPLHFDCNNGFLSEGWFYPNSTGNSYYDVYSVVQWHNYICLTGPNYGGNVFRAAFFTRDPSLATSQFSGTRISVDKEGNVSCLIKSYDSYRAFSPSNNGFIAIQKTNVGTTNLKSYLIELETIT